MRLKLTIAYDGQPFLGWQSQAGGRTVQDALEAAVSAIEGERVSVQGAGRTDAGVHALGQVAHCEVTPRVPLDRWQRAINNELPPTIRVVRCVKGASDFHARFSATGKIYGFRIWNGTYLPPHELGRSWFVPGRFDAEVLQEAGQLLVGQHDFAGFTANLKGAKRDTVRTVRSIRVRRRGSLISVDFEGSGFLYKMVRLLTGSMIRVAQGRADAGWLKDVLARRASTHFAGNAEGLYLKRVLYGVRK